MEDFAKIVISQGRRESGFFVARGGLGLYNPQALNLAIFTLAWFFGRFNE